SRGLSISVGVRHLQIGGPPPFIGGPQTPLTSEAPRNAQYGCNRGAIRSFVESLDDEFGQPVIDKVAVPSECSEVIEGSH
ncbi:MAG: hypothetical protein ABSB09_12850, partial [Acidimicrobiales bacterium]